MDRRTALKQTAMLLGSSVAGAELFLSGCAAKEDGSTSFLTGQLALMDEIGETILPDSEESPGAKAANIGLFMATMVADCYDKEEQDLFASGLGAIDQLAVNRYSRGFLNLTQPQRTELLTELDAEATLASKEGRPHFYTLMKQLTLLGYFTSEIGVTQALRYDSAPGSYDGCVPYDGTNPAWYGPTSSIG